MISDLRPSTFRTSTLEVIALSVEDAVAAAHGGADRLEVTRALEADGLTPLVGTVAAMREAADLPLRVMLRSNAGFTTDARELADLCRSVEALQAAGADAFVFGFLTPAGELDLPAMATLAAAVAPCPWTLHRAIDHAADARAVWNAAQALPCLDIVLSGGGPDGLPAGLGALRARASWQTTSVRLLAGGGLLPEHLPPLRAAGITQFHVGRFARRGHRWEQPVDEAAVRQLRQALDTPAE
jgi:copper homeostasis protein